MNPTPLKAIIIAEQEYEGTLYFNTPQELEAYAQGLSKGADLYGAGGCGLYTLADIQPGGTYHKPNDPYSQKTHNIIQKHLNQPS